MDVFLELRTTEPNEVRDTIAEHAAAGGTDIAISDEVHLRFAAIEPRRDSTALVIFALTFPMGIATNVIADQITDFLRRRKARDRVTRASIAFEEEAQQRDGEGSPVTTRTTRRVDISIE